MNIDYMQKNNTFIFSFVRMNPPTPGHLSLIKSMIDKAIELKTNSVYIITSSSLDGKNPLPCSRETMPTQDKKTKADKNILSNMSIQDLAYKSNILHP